MAKRYVVKRIWKDDDLGAAGSEYLSDILGGSGRIDWVSDISHSLFYSEPLNAFAALQKITALGIDANVMEILMTETPMKFEIKPK